MIYVSFSMEKLMQPFDKKKKIQPGIDKNLIAMFLKMTYEERLLSNDNAICAIMELRDGFKRRKAPGNRSKRSA